jgi:hypothetical protein
MIEVALRLIERRLGLLVCRKFVDREIGLAQELVERIAELLPPQLQLELRRKQRGLCVVEVHLGARPARGERDLALHVVAAQIDRLPTCWPSRTKTVMTLPEMSGVIRTLCAPT